MGIPLEEYAEASFGIVAVHALPIMTVAASETMPRRDITGIPPGLSRFQNSGLQKHSGKNFPMPLLVPLAKLRRNRLERAVCRAVELEADRELNPQISGQRFGAGQTMARLGSPSLERKIGHTGAAGFVQGSVPSQPPTTAGPRDARVPNIWSPAGRSRARIDPLHRSGWRICRGNLRLDPHIARLSLLPPVS
jgi:hypothetical protein